METSEILHGNKVIAEFMGFKPAQKMQIRFNLGLDKYYHSSWDWLMPVVEKIEKTMVSDEAWVDVTIGCGRYCVIQDNVEGQFEFTGMEETKILSTWKTCVEFIEWYNQNK
jgi:hypothetical protein